MSTPPANEMKKTKTNVNTLIVFLLDRSYSIITNGMKDEIISGYNQFVNQQLKQIDSNVNDNIYMSLYQFDTSVRRDYKEVPIGADVLLNSDSYQPEGMTALYDAIDESAKEHLDQKLDRDYMTKIFIVLTDGEDNSSCSSLSDARVRMKDLEKANWTVRFLGASLNKPAKSHNMCNQFAHRTIMNDFNEDSIEAARLGLSRQSSQTYVPTNLGVKKVLRSLTNDVTNTRHERYIRHGLTQ